ncbi:phospholipase [Niallia circulans]|uniref:Phospholipase n=1 Tax=Niallia circulans TaxID=1397 RepID=A0A268FHR4_NIACI|nr:phospholipase D-like domain-containing protein [Niallia circulans]AYV66415.1 phospholipase [Niallia circulans]AYV70767.1 phospholipase [Niallia circulans]PAD84894.1 phospholipase [Niallia circulans]
MKRIFFLLFIIFIMFYSGTIYHHLKKPLPKGLSIEGVIHQVKDVELLIDITYKNNKKNRMVQHEIINSMLKEVEKANEFIIIDMFLFNNDTNEDQQYPKIVEKFTEALIKKKQENPMINIIFITDKINTVYDSYPSEEFKQLKENGVKVIETELNDLRDSNPLYSGFWRMFGQWVKTRGNGHLPNFLAKSAPKVSAISYLELLNIKANHRKVMITENTAIISSGNIHNASGYHSNVAFKLHGNILNELLKSEESAARLSEPIDLPRIKEQAETKNTNVKIQLLTEGKIGKHILQEIKNTQKSEVIWIGMLYLADQKVIKEIKAAAKRDVKIYIILDPNQNAFGNKKTGLPNIPVVAELRKAKAANNIHIKWYNAGKEQFHPKLLYIERLKARESTIISGSANLTQRNLYDFNLETDIKIIARQKEKIMRDTKRYFQKLWENEQADFTKEVDRQKNFPIFRYIIYRLQRMLGFTTY